MSFIRIFCIEKAILFQNYMSSIFIFVDSRPQYSSRGVSENRFSVGEKSVFLFIPVGVDPLRGFE